MLRPQAVQQLNLPKDAIQHVYWVGLLLLVTELTFNICSDAHIKTGGAPPHLRLGCVRVENNIKTLRGPLMDEPKSVVTSINDPVEVLQLDRLSHLDTLLNRLRKLVELFPLLLI